MIELPTVLVALGWTLVHFVWQGSLIAAVFGVSRQVVRRSTPESHYALACTTILAMALVPLGTFALFWSALPPDGSLGPTTVPVAATAVPRIAESWRSMVPRAMPAILAIWSLGVGILAARATVGWFALRRIIANDARVLAPAWQRRVAGLIERIGLGCRGIRVLSTPRVSIPIVTGCWRPTILLPLSVFTGLPVDHLEALVLHELAHIKRRDLWVHRGQLMLETLFFYHPAVWWVSRVIHVERELCCDAAVVALTGDRLGYARALTEIESLRSKTPQPALAITGGSLMSRVRSIVNPTQSSGPTLISTAAWSLVALGLVVGLIATTGVLSGSASGSTPAWMPGSVDRWSPQIKKAAKRHDVDPALLSIVTLVESRGNPEAVSSRGAVGLMQIMPATAEKIAAARGIDGFDIADLVDPATNIDFGAWYLARQIAEFGDGSLTPETIGRAAAAYNGGPTRLRAHLEQGRPLSRESENYSRLVRQLWLERDRTDSSTLEDLPGLRM